ncbi:MAG: SDR family oxidoreductase [Armatimonadota bacterium]
MAQALTGKTVLVTGAAKRLGRAIALACAAEGANVVVHYHRSAEAAASLREELLALGVQGWTIQADLGNSREYTPLIERALALAGGLDVLVNNASTFPPAKLEDLMFDDLVASLEVNAWSPFVLCREFARLVGRGAIVNLLDTRLVGYDMEHAGYILSKHVLAVLTRMTALRFAPDITVNAVAPGLILPPPGGDEAYLDAQAVKLPLKRHGNPADIAEAVVYLAKSTYVTGQTIFVDGGRHLRVGS